MCSWSPTRRTSPASAALPAANAPPPDQDGTNVDQPAPRFAARASPVTARFPPTPASPDVNICDALIVANSAVIVDAKMLISGWLPLPAPYNVIRAGICGPPPVVLNG